jgi:hypothetical protein
MHGISRQGTLPAIWKLLRSICLLRCWDPVTPHLPAGRSGLCALSVHNPSAGEGPSRTG